MKRSIALAFLLVFAGLAFYFYFAEETCPVHCCPAPVGSFNHVHGGPAAVCLCFWSTLFAPVTFDLAHFLRTGLRPADPLDRTPLVAFRADVGHPPKTLPA
ncbi:MAG TPA: hypothetical protein VMS75_04620 [Terriglobales bacterium]|nr:hypothetical protein [Terriglobales bacterium]